MRNLIAAVLMTMSAHVMAATDGMIGTYHGAPNFASVVRDGAIVNLTSGMRIAQGETIFTGGTAGMDKRAAINLDDKSVIALRQHSQFIVDQFRLPAEASGESGALLGRLMRGGFRAITGMIAKARKESVQYTTTTATIGIRGTDFTARECNNDCQDIGVEENGLLLQVDDGEVNVANQYGDKTIGANEALFAAEEEVPRLAPYIPEMSIKLPASLPVGRGC